MMNKNEIDIIYDNLVKSGKRFDNFKWGDGSKYWIKRRERFKLKHILKGHPAKAIKRETAGIKVLKRCGIPVPNVVYKDERCIVTEDVGPHLQDIAIDKRIGVAEKEKIFSSAGKIMAALHKQRYAHGGLALRDVCWDGTAITLLDLESFDELIRSQRKLSIDFYLFIHSWFKLFETEKPELMAFVDAYKNNIIAVQWQKSLDLPLYLQILSKLFTLLKYKKSDIIALTRTVNFLNKLKQ
ncbi:MAG: hypothetical protein CML88_03115 [Rhodobiaceae bacterium]|nr:hypothetical protein [Rhodobiaceae bacterium]